MTQSQPQGLATVMTALRGLLMGAIGIFALLAPERALQLLVFVGGGVLVLDGILDLAAMQFRAPRTRMFWLSMIRNLLSILAGLIVLFSPVLIPLLTVGFVIYFVGLQAIFSGVITIFTVFAQRDKYPSIWQPLFSGCLYIAFGLVLLMMPLSSAIVLTQVVALLMILYAISLFVQAFRRRARGY